MCCRGSEASPSGDSKGHSPWRAFGDFPRDGKVTRVQGGAPAGGCRDYQSRKSPRGAGRSARIGGCRDYQSRKSPRGAGRSARIGGCRDCRPAKARGEKGGKYKREEPNGSSLLS